MGQSTHLITCNKGVGDGATSEARPLPLFDSSSNKNNQKSLLVLRNACFPFYINFMKIVFKRDRHTHNVVSRYIYS